MLETGDPAPDFTLLADNGEEVSLGSLRGRVVVLYFYPRDDTRGCTRQACAIRDGWEEFARAGAVVLGVSRDSVASHRGFKQKYSLPFPLLTDTDHAVAEAYGVWVEKTNYGRTSFGIERSGFVIDPAGNLAAIKRRVKADDHAAWALAELAKITTNA